MARGSQDIGGCLACTIPKLHARCTGVLATSIKEQNGSEKMSIDQSNYN
jgi:hypothetical protein